MKRLILIHPMQPGLLEGFSSGLVALANYAAAKLRDTSVHLVDLGNSSEAEVPRQLQGFLRREDTIFAGITSTTASYQAALQVARVIKRLAPHAIVIFGGHHASAQDRPILTHHAYVDYVIRGEGEVALAMLVAKHPVVDKVPGLSYRRGLEIVANSTAKELGLLLTPAELDRIPATYQGWGLRSAPGKFEHVTYVSARGCPLRCAFCAVANDLIRAKSVPAVIADLRHLVGDLGYKSLAVEDNFFAASPKRTKELCRAMAELQKELPFRWDCQTRVESCMNEEVIRAMEEAGCEAVYLGVEALDEGHLKYLRKTPSPEKYLANLRDVVLPRLVRSSIGCYINLQLGIPYESADVRAKTIERLAQLGRIALDYGRGITLFTQLHVTYPGTEHYWTALRDGNFGPSGDNIFEEFTRWEARQQPVLNWLGEHFAHGTGGIPIGILQADALRQRSEFRVEAHAVIEIVNFLSRLRAVPGITVFSYGKYLSRPASPSPALAAVSHSLS